MNQASSISLCEVSLTVSFSLPGCENDVRDLTEVYNLQFCSTLLFKLLSFLLLSESSLPFATFLNVVFGENYAFQ
jgi:hypothetical protein